MTEKQGNTRLSNLNYIHTEVNMKKKHVKAKSRTSRKLRKGAIFKERKSRTKNRATRENDPRCSSFVVKDDHDVTQLVELLRCVRRWLMRPVRARKPLPHVEQ